MHLEIICSVRVLFLSKSTVSCVVFQYFKLISTIISSKFAIFLMLEAVVSNMVGIVLSFLLSLRISAWIIILYTLYDDPLPNVKFSVLKFLLQSFESFKLLKQTLYFYFLLVFNFLIYLHLLLCCRLLTYVHLLLYLAFLRWFCWLFGFELQKYLLNKLFHCRV